MMPVNEELLFPCVFERVGDSILKRHGPSLSPRRLPRRLLHPGASGAQERFPQRSLSGRLVVAYRFAQGLGRAARSSSPVAAEQASPSRDSAAISLSPSSRDNSRLSSCRDLDCCWSPRISAAHPRLSRAYWSLPLCPRSPSNTTASSFNVAPRSGSP